MALRSVNPATGVTVHEYPEAGAEEVEAILARAHAAQPAWRATGFDARARAVGAAARVLREKAGALARLMAVEMGKPLAQGESEVEKCAWVCEHSAAHAARDLASIDVPTDARRSYVAFEPLGVVLAVMPWNFPLWQVFRFAAPNLMAGNAAVLKHASNVTGCALAIETVFREAGVPEEVFGVLRIGSARVAEAIASPHVHAVTLTGSTPAGRAVARAAGERLKKTVLELGGSDPYLVLDDGDVDAAAETCAASRLVNSGQSCIAAKRFIVMETVRRRFEEVFVARMAARRMGDPLLPGVDVGPQARRDLRDGVHEQTQRTIASGARVLLGATLPDGPGAFYPPTVLTGVPKGTPAWDEEIFGPVAAVIPARDEDEAVRIANDTPFGLGAAVFSEDRDRALRVAARLEAGSVFVNALVKSDPRLPFGGIKDSGYGRELSAFGIREFVNVKTVYVQ